MSHVNKDKMILALIETLCQVLQKTGAVSPSLESLIRVLQEQGKENFIGLSTAQQLIDRVNEELIYPS